MDGHNYSNDPKRIKLPRLLEPIDSAALRKEKISENTKKRNYNIGENTSTSLFDGKHSQGITDAIPNCCSALRCRCDPGDIDDCLCGIEKQLQNTANCDDNYLWTKIKDMPENVKTEKSGAYFENEENCIRSKGIDLTIVGTGMENNRRIGELTKLKESGCIANIRVATAGLAFEVFNKGVHSRNYEKILSTSPTLRSKKHTAEDLDNKLKKAEIRRKARLAEKMDKYKAMVCKYKQRAHQIEEMDRERHEKGIKRIERQMKRPIMVDKKDWTSLIRDCGRNRTRSSRIADLLEKRQMSSNVKPHRIDPTDRKLERNFDTKMGLISRIKSTMDVAKFPSDHQLTFKKNELKPRISPSLTLVEKQSAEHFEQSFTPSPSLSVKNASPSGAGDGQECFGNRQT